MRINQTIEKFGYPDTLVSDLGEWVILLRPKQVTLGSLVLAAADPATAFGDLNAGSFSTLGAAVHRIEQVLKNTFHCDKLNYLMLMMVDPHVHFHVIPRYATPHTFAGQTFEDKSWPKPPDLTQNLDMTPETFEHLRKMLSTAFAA